MLPRRLFTLEYRAICCSWLSLDQFRIYATQTVAHSLYRKLEWGSTGCFGSCMTQHDVMPLRDMIPCSFECTDRNGDCIRFYFDPATSMCHLGGTMLYPENSNIELYAKTNVGTIRRRYLGCFQDYPTRDLTGDTMASNNLTPDICIDFCVSRGFRYAGVQYSDGCFCGQTYGMYGNLPESDCNMPCRGNSYIRCGAGYKSNIYETGQ